MKNTKPIFLSVLILICLVLAGCQTTTITAGTSTPAPKGNVEQPLGQFEKRPVTDDERKVLKSIWTSEADKKKIDDNDMDGHLLNAYRELIELKVSLAEKYPGHTFLVESMDLGGIVPDHTFRIYEETAPEVLYTARLVSTEGEYAYEDNYYASYVSEAYNNKLKTLLEENGVAVTAVSIEFTSLQGYIDLDKLTVQYVMSDDCTLPRDTAIYLPGNENDLSSCRDVLRENGIAGSFRIYSSTHFEELMTAAECWEIWTTKRDDTFKSESLVIG